MRFLGWSAWKLDHITWGWIVQILFFFIWEAYAIARDPMRDPLTMHLRPIFAASDITWWLAFGIWLWLGTHFLLPIPPSVLGRE